MPLYEYVCTACQHQFEEMQKFSDKPITVCPECGKKKVEKKVSLSGFQLSGSGWYKDGYSKPSDKKSPDGKTAATGTDKKSPCANGACAAPKTTSAA